LSSDRSFERLYRRHVEDVYRYALAVLANRTDAEDVTQTTFLNAYRSYRSGTLPAKPLNWLISIAHNVCRQRFRTAARRPPEVALDTQLAVAEDDGDRFRAEDIRRALAALTFAQRSALALRELEGRSYREIAAMLELSESAVETLIFRARKAFREQLEETLTCSQAEQAISRQLDGVLALDERRALRSHLRECEACSVLARRFRAQRSALKRFVLVPLPQSLASFSAGGSSVAASGAAVGSALGVKALVLGSAAIVAVGVTTGEIVTHSKKPPAKAPAPAAHREAAPVQRPTIAPSRTVPTAVTSLVSLVRVRPSARAAQASRVRHKPTTRSRRSQPVAHPPHPVTPSLQIAESPVVAKPAAQGNGGRSATAPRREQVTLHQKPKPVLHPRKHVVQSAHRTHPAAKAHPVAAEHTSSSVSADPVPPATVPIDPGLPAEEAHETGKPADTPGVGPPASAAQKERG
jgi:RNA polymerase sigma factor (sigma-70 family)